MNFNEPLANQGSPSKARVRFLAEDAAQERLYLGKAFELYEGAIKVANVICISGSGKI